MKIAKALNEVQYLRVSYNGKWLYRNCRGWVVREHKPYQKGSTVVIETCSEDKAVNELVKGYNKD